MQAREYRKECLTKVYCNIECRARSGNDCTRPEGNIAKGLKSKYYIAIREIHVGCNCNLSDE